jgi:predicted permease
MDLRYALRTLSKTPGFSLVAVLVLALGIGANTAIFSVINAVLLRPLPYSDPDRIVTIWSSRHNSANVSQVSGPDYHDFHNQSSAFEAMAYYQSGGTSVLAGQEPEQVTNARVTPEFFRVFDVQPAIGNTPTDTQGVAISYAFWQRSFGGDAKALGRSLKMYDRSFTVVGVMPPGFQFPGNCDVWASSALFPETVSRTGHNYRVVARLKRGTSLAEAQAQMSTIASRLEKQFPENVNKGAALVPLHEQMVRTSRPTLYLLLAAVALVLLIACANVANLLLARATGRTREIAIRAALGASRKRILRQLIVESLVLALCAGFAGSLLALWANEVLIRLAPGAVPRITESRLDGWVFAFTLLISIGASILFGLAPAYHASKTDLSNALKQGSRGGLGGSSGRLRNALVAGEIALAMMLVAAAGLMIKSFSALNNVDPGFRSAGVLVMLSSVPYSNEEGAKRGVRFYEELLRRTAQIPGVQTLGATRDLPTQSSSNGLYQIEGRPPLPPADWGKQQAGFRLISGGYFRTMNIPLRSGRDFTEADNLEAQPVAIISESLARASFPNEDPIGRRLRCGLDNVGMMTIVGVVADIRQLALDKVPGPELYMPYAQHPYMGNALKLVLRTSVDSGAMQETLRRTTRALNPELPVRFTTVDKTIADSVAPPRFRAQVVGVFAGLAVLLAMAGVYGVMAYSVGQRKTEIGLRMALGARSGEVLGLVLRQAAVLVGVGLALGLAGSLATSQLMEKFLFEVRPTDIATYALVSFALAVAGLTASFIPARRAASVDPIIALREE